MKNILFILLTLLVWSSCDVEDKGNYDYTEVNGVTIEGVESSYEKIGKVDELVIEPQIKGSILGEDESNYEYSWFLTYDDFQHKILSTEKNLKWKVDLPAGTHSLYFQIVDKSTGLQWLKGIALKVTTFFTKGFLLFGDTEAGEARLDMVIMPVGQDTTVAENVYDNSTYHLSNVRGMFFSGSSPFNPVVKSLWLLTDEVDIRITSGSYFSDFGEFNELGIIETDAEHISPMRIMDFFPHQNAAGIRSDRNRGYITEDMIVMKSMIGTTADYYSTPVNKYSNSPKLFKPYPLAFVRGASSFYSVSAMFYDMDEQCFVKANSDYGQTTYCVKLKDGPKDPFPWNQKGTGRTIVYGENGYELNDGDSHAIMKDEEGHYYIYTFKTQDGDYFWYTPTKKGGYEVEFAIAQGFNEASHYMFSSAKSVVVYAVGSMLWAYDYSRKQITSMDLGAEITCLEAEYCSTRSLSDFIVATYDADTHKGVVRKLQIGGDNDEVKIIEKPREIWEVTMKVKFIEWKDADDNKLEKPEEDGK